MAPPSISDYIVALGKQVKNQQKLLSYYGELYEFYNDKLPKNKYIYYLEENPYTEPFSVASPEALNFFQTGITKLNMLTPYIRIYKKFKNKNKKVKKIEFPFENKTDFKSFEDPIGYIGGSPNFMSERFMGPVAALTSLEFSYKGIGGKGAIPTTTHIVTTSLTIELQDVKLLFKNWHPSENIKYQDIFGQPVPGKNHYSIILEVGYNVPDGFDPTLTELAKKKLVLDLMPLAPKTKLVYNADGSATLTTQLTGHAAELTDDINLLNSKYYKQVKQKSNMQTLTDEEKYTIGSYEKQLDNLVRLRKEAESNAATAADAQDTDAAPDEKESAQEGTNFKSLEKKIDLMRRQIQIAHTAMAAPPSFSFVAALYEAARIYYIELDNDRYANYIEKIADGIPVDVSKIGLLPKRKQNLRLQPDDFLKKSAEKTDYSAGSLHIRSFNDSPDGPDSSGSNFEKIKFFYFGDLVNVILNNQTGGGVGQDLDEFGEDIFKILLGPTVWVKNKNLKKIYNIANTPISLDMFLFELNKEIYSKDKKRMSLGEFFGVFMKRFFDIVVLSAEKQKTGRDQQQYTGKLNYVFDKDKILGANKFLKALYNYAPTVDTVDTTNFLVITTILENKKISSKTRKGRVPIIYLGGPDRGPLISIGFDVVAVKGLAERSLARQYYSNLNQGSAETIGETRYDSILISGKTKATVELKGNPFLRLMDFVLIDTRFVDGGFFQKDNNLIFFTGYFYIYEVVHSFKGNDWTTKYSMNWMDRHETATFNSHRGEFPKSQDVSLTEKAQADRNQLVAGTQEGTGASGPDSKTTEEKTASKPSKPKNPPEPVGPTDQLDPM